MIEPGLEVELLGLGLGNGDVGDLGGQLGDVVEVLAQLVAQLAELGLAVVLEAELEGHARDVVVEVLDVRVGAQQLQALAVRLPQELDPGGQDGAVGAVLGVLAGNGTEKWT